MRFFTIFWQADRLAIESVKSLFYNEPREVVIFSQNGQM